MNFKKLMIVVVTIVVIISAWKYFTRVDRTNAVAVANAFTKALKGQDTSAASKYYLPSEAEAWRQKIDERVEGMKSGRKADFFERIPSSPEFTSPVTAAGKTLIASADRQYTLEMTQIDGKWYVAKD